MVAVEVVEKGRGALATSGRLWAAFVAICFSRPRSSRRTFTIAWMSEDERRAAPHEVQGPRPSFAQTIFPQLRQLGAAVRRACRCAMQLQRRRRVAFSCSCEFTEAARDGFVWISRARMAESRSLSVADWPRMEVPPDRAILVLEGWALLAGEAEREEGSASEMRVPEADGGSLRDCWC